MNSEEVFAGFLCEKAFKSVYCGLVNTSDGVVCVSVCFLRGYAGDGDSNAIKEVTLLVPFFSTSVDTVFLACLLSFGAW